MKKGLNGSRSLHIAVTWAVSSLVWTSKQIYMSGPSAFRTLPICSTASRIDSTGPASPRPAPRTGPMSRAGPTSQISIPRRPCSSNSRQGPRWSDPDNGGSRPPCPGQDPSSSLYTGISSALPFVFHIAMSTALSAPMMAAIRDSIGESMGGESCDGVAAYGTARPASASVHRSLSTATWPLTRTYGIPVGNCTGSS